jgi:epoxyqueuosine reductase
MLHALMEWASNAGYSVGWFESSVVAEARDRIVKLRSEGVFDDLFYEQFLSWMERPEILLPAEEKSIILVAVPRPAHVVTFDYRGKRLELILPPTYYNYSGMFDEVKEDLEAFLKNRIPLRTIKAPLKYLATATGFARYGLNNIAYVRALGSYVQLLAYAARIPVGDGGGRTSTEPAILEECQTCGACQRACPTGAIRSERFLIYAERCMTYFSEREGLLPEAFGKVKRPCLVGCLACQMVCPVNKGLLRFEKLAIRFSETETNSIMGVVGDRKLAPATRAKVTALKSNEFGVCGGRPNATLQRNLTAVLRQQASVPKERKE